MSSAEPIKAQAQARFSQFAQVYVSSERHASGPELARLLELAQPQRGWLALDVATGGQPDERGPDIGAVTDA